MIKKKDLTTGSVNEVETGNNVHDNELTVFIEPLLPQVSEGTYKFFVSDVGVENVLDSYNRPAKKVSIDFVLQHHEGNELIETPIKQRYTVSSSPRSWFFEAYTSLTGVQPQGNVNLKGLLSKEGTCDIEHWEMPNGNVIARVVNINPNIDSEADESEEFDEMEF